jgi:hypothetical protein
LLDGDVIEIIVDRNTLEGTVNLLGLDGSASSGTALLASRALRTDLRSDKDLPDDTRLWAALQDVGGGAWGGCVYDVEKILEVIAAGKRVMEAGARRASRVP